jgi:hypothetical protein
MIRYSPAEANMTFSFAWMDIGYDNTLKVIPGKNICYIVDFNDYFSVSEKLLSFEESTLVNVQLSFRSDEARWTRSMDANQKSHVALDGL